MADLRPYVETKVDNTLLNIQNARSIVTIAMVAPTANTLSSSLVHEFTDPDTAISVLGADTSLGNMASKYITDIFAQTNKVLLKFVSAGTNTLSGTATTLNQGANIVSGTKVITLTDASILSVGDYIAIDVGTSQEYRKVLNIAVNDVTINALDKDHVDGVAVELVTQYANGNLALARTALQNEQFRLYSEDSYGEISNITTFLNGRDAIQLFTQSIQGIDSGVDIATAKTYVDSADTDKYQIYVYGIGTDKKDGVTYEGGNFVANKCLAKYAKKLSETADQNTILYSLNSISLEELSDVRKNNDSSLFTIAEVDDLVDNNVSAIINKRVASTNSIRIHKIVTTYSSDGTFPSTRYSNIADINGEIYIRDNMSDETDNFLAEQIAATPPKPITTGNLERLRAFEQQVLNSYDFFDTNPETSGFTPKLSVTSPSAGKAQVDVTYKLQESIDQVTITLFKSIR